MKFSQEKRGSLEENRQSKLIARITIGKLVQLCFEKALNIISLQSHNFSKK